MGDFISLSTSGNRGFGIALSRGCSYRVSGSTFNGDAQGGMVINQGGNCNVYPIALTSNTFTRSGGHGLWVSSANVSPVFCAGCTATFNAFNGIISEANAVLSLIGGNFSGNGTAGANSRGGYGVLVDNGQLLAAGITAQTNYANGVGVTTPANFATVADSHTLVDCALITTCNQAGNY
jgi:hypothetical protein